MIPQTYAYQIADSRIGEPRVIHVTLPPLPFPIERSDRSETEPTGRIVRGDGFDIKKDDLQRRVVRLK